MASQLSVVVPTYNETANLRPLCERLFAAVRAASLECELIFADDESEGSAESSEIVAQLAREGYAVRIHTRLRGEGRGLSSAVLLGFDQSRHATLLCMDADLQHEPEAVPAVAGPVLRGEADFAIGSRNVGEGGIGFEWSLARRVISKGATLLAAPLTRSTDPMSGFFCVTRARLDEGRAVCNPLGFKIALEIMVRCRCQTVVDVPITFRDRVAGESKLSAKQNVEYVRQLLSLYWFAYAKAIVALLVAAFAALLAIFNHLAQ